MNAAKDLGTHYTYADYLTWPENEHIELIDGVPVMHATPNINHQIISGEIFAQLHDILKGKPCKVLSAPVIVRLAALDNESDDTILETDIIVMCNLEKLTKQSCNGAPDFVVEILSPSTARYDLIEKFEKFMKAGAKEYWIVDPETKTVQTHILDNGKYYTQANDDKGIIPIVALGGCEINFEDVFAE